MHSSKETNPKQVTFTDEQIRFKAYLISQKYPERSPDENWAAAIQALEKQTELETTEIEKTGNELQWDGIKKIPNGFQNWPYIRKFWSTLRDDKEREAIKVIISMFGILTTTFAAIGLIWTVWDSNENRKLTQQQLIQEKEQFLGDKELNQQRLITDRFAKSASLLSDEDKAVRIAAIFSLERIAKDSPKDHWTIMELLSAYILERSPLGEKDKVAKNEKDKASVPIYSPWAEIAEML